METIKISVDSFCNSDAYERSQQKSQTFKSKLQIPLFGAFSVKALFELHLLTKAEAIDCIRATHPTKEL